MRLTQYSASSPAAIAAAALIVLLFGALALLRLPIQLLPDTKDPQIWINVQWREAAPSEVEEALVEPIEEAMRGLSGMKEMRSQINRGGGGVSLTFEIGTDMTRVMLDVVSRINTLPPLPPDAEEPQVFDGAPWTRENAASILVRPLPGNNTQDMAATYQKLMEEVVEPRLSRVEGVSQVDLEGGRPSEVQIRFDTHRLASLGITPRQLAQTVIGARDSSAGFVDVGRRQFTVRFTGREPVAELGSLIVGWSNDRPLYLRDVADIAVGLQDQQAFSFRNGVPGYYLTIRRTSTANIVQVLDGVKRALAELNAGPLGREQLVADLSWDASVYVRRAIGFVQESLIIGVLLAVGGLWYFLRGPRALLVIGATIPLSLAFAVITLHLLGRSLNTISLAGLAFSTGIVTDAALIVQGNIIRFIQQGRTALDATIDGAQEVIPALLASMLTSVAIFLPVLFMEGLEGQLFKDLAITMSVSHAASLLVAMTVIPAANRWALATRIPDDQHDHWWKAMARSGMRATATPARRALLIGLLVPGSLLFSYLAAPKPDYLPVAQTDNVWGNFSTPPGGNIDTVRREMAPVVIERLKPYLEGRAQPAIKYYNFSAWGGGGGGLVVAYAADPTQTRDVVDLLRTKILADLPDVRVYASQGSLFNLDGGTARNIELYLQGPDLNALMTAARVAETEIPLAIPGTFPRSQPALELNQPEIQLQPDEWRISRAGATRGDVADALRSFTGGLWAGEYFDGNERLDIIVKSQQWHSPEELAELPIATPAAGIQTVGELAQIRQTVGPSQLSRVNGRRTVSVNFEPPDTMSLDEAISILQSKVEPKLREAMSQNMQLSYGGSANQLAEALKSMASNFALALVMLMVLMSALFKSLWDSLLVMLVIPISIAGGIGALRLIGWFDFQALDLLTMIGFIILLGLVVNAAILLVDQTRAREHAGMLRADAVREALETRARPIVLSTLTAVLGMVPLILMPGLGAKIYRGLAAVVSGGMIVGTLFTWYLMPALLRLGESRMRAAEKPSAPEVFVK
ncbi:Multidrug efflux pump subunit AcrB [Hydrocarboniphaga daqingensis]|uniref:Multidrug efflux pump subunit AcrB n=1 Tax=Hydrocarboniphaga daqingensis TaxID=490188 RepID=A0A1M5L7E7_9GAMM|nr:efflux RND transporter permease subunit [Hydrocarboniphaga daqingensis]SHG60931.1 Multidrug efflux pump subunit AcrB [Hydrocarboniphaga daqingensis]